MRHLAIAAFLLLAAASLIEACCECTCRKVDPSLIEGRSWAGCGGNTRVPFTNIPPYFVERNNCDGACSSGRVLGFFPTADAPWSDAWVDVDALGAAFPCSFKDNRCTVFAPTRCAVAGVNRTEATAMCPAGSRARTCRDTQRPCTLRCLMQEPNVCDDRLHFCNFLKHGQVFCEQVDCGSGWVGGTAPGIQPQASILASDLIDI